MKHTNTKANFAKSLFLLLLFSLPILLCLFSLTYEVTYIYSLPSTLYYTSLIIIFFIFITITFFLHKYIAKRATQKKYEALFDLQTYQKEHYRHIEAQRRHLNLLKHNFQNQISLISELLSDNQEEQAATLLNALTEQVNSTKEYPYCPSPIINAVLSGKERECQLSSIAFQAELQISTCDTIPASYLCSIFANLLDNAINACQKIDTASERYIHLTAKQAGDYLHIKVRNSSLPPKAPKVGHGFGQKILKDIADKYHGSFQTRYEKRTYEAYLSIQFPK